MRAPERATDAEHAAAAAAPSGGGEDQEREARIRESLRASLIACGIRPSSAVDAMLADFAHGWIGECLREWGQRQKRANKPGPAILARNIRDAGAYAEWRKAERTRLDRVRRANETTERADAHQADARARQAEQSAAEFASREAIARLSEADLAALCESVIAEQKSAMARRRLESTLAKARTSPLWTALLAIAMRERAQKEPANV